MIDVGVEDLNNTTEAISIENCAKITNHFLLKQNRDNVFLLLHPKIMINPMEDQTKKLLSIKFILMKAKN